MFKTGKQLGKSSPGPSILLTKVYTYVCVCIYIYIYIYKKYTHICVYIYWLMEVVDILNVELSRGVFIPCFGRGRELKIFMNISNAYPTQINNNY